MLDTLKVTLYSNENIDNSVKENLLELITIFSSAFNEIDLTNLNTRLKTLKIKVESKFLVRMPCRYNAFTNEILINEEMFSNCDARHWMMHCLLGVITGKENRFGFTTTDNKMIALCEGYTEILTNYLVGDVENNYFTDEIIMTNLISKVIGEDTLFEAYFNNDSEKVLKAMVDAEGK